jgi:hypothetical protein
MKKNDSRILQNSSDFIHQGCLYFPLGMIMIGAIKIENRDKMWEYFLKN